MDNEDFWEQQEFSDQTTKEKLTIQEKLAACKLMKLRSNEKNESE